MLLPSMMPVCIAMVRLTRMGRIPLLFEITRVPVTDRNAFHRNWWFDLLLPKASAQIERQQGYGLASKMWTAPMSSCSLPPGWLSGALDGSRRTPLATIAISRLFRISNPRWECNSPPTERRGEALYDPVGFMVFARLRPVPGERADR